ncbi:unnamed protein product [Pleuronectes platessa]|uniref:Uncharacterized protein n=1 Tax=Pleuronectes platessa TaxID=8262 RepID=A0A9N7YMJ6_PLEPL|nr:unnamed protein product [Pleuronectes platessa]
MITSNTTQRGSSFLNVLRELALPDTEAQDAVDETASPSEGKTHQEHHSRKVKKKIWSKAEEAAVMRHFKAYILKGRLATKHECSHCKMVEGSVLAQRTVAKYKGLCEKPGNNCKREGRAAKADIGKG